MRKIILLSSFLIISFFSVAQKIETIKFNLYTDSLKKGFYNYINVDGKFSDGSWLPMGSDEIILSVKTNKGQDSNFYFQGNSLFIDSAYTGETVTVKAVLKNNPAIWQEATIYIRKRGFDEPLKSNDEILEEMRQTRKKPKQRTG